MVERESHDEQAEAILETACPSEDRAQKTRSAAVGSFVQIRPRCQVAIRRRLLNQPQI
jgi:hypothetical protein